MSIRYPAGFIRIGYDPLKVPNAPTIGTATEGDTQASVAFTAPSNVGGSAISAYYAVSNPGQITGTAASSPVTVTGLNNGTAYTFAVWALNTYGPSTLSGASNSVTPAVPPYGLFGGGVDSSNTIYNTISYININTTGNAANFGQLTVARTSLAACSSTTRGVFMGGGNYGYAAGVNVMDYVTITSTGNATDFGDLNDTNTMWGASCSNTTRGIFTGASGNTDTRYITIATTGNTTFFGSNGQTSFNNSGAGNSTRGIIFGGAYTSANIGTLQIATLGNMALFGTGPSVTYSASCSSATRALNAGGQTSSACTITYVTIASTGSTSNFGNLTVAPTNYKGATSSATRGVFAGAYNNVSNIEYVTIASLGNSTFFGNLPVINYFRELAGCSNAHGGLQ